MLNKFKVFILIVVSLAIAVSCSKKEEEKVAVEPAKRVYFLEKVRNVLVVQAYADAFRDLSFDEKMLAWHLYRSAIAGRDITYDQNHKHALKIRNLLEGIVEYNEGIDSVVYAKILDYTKMFWINNCQYDNLTSRKFVPGVSFLEFSRAANTALKNGAGMGLDAGEDLNKLLGVLRPYMFDRNFEPILTNKNPAEGEDLISGSANNLYEGVTLADVEAFDEKYPLNSKVAVVDGEIVELVYRAGTDEIPAGMYAEELERSAAELESAAAYCDSAQAEVLRLLAKYFRTGEPEDFRQYNIAWVQNSSFFDIINGFIEVYKDARAQKGSYEAVVQMVDKETTGLMQKFAAEAQYFEDKEPWKDEYKRQEISPPIANVVTILIETGDSGPISPGGINLPNAQDIRQQYGSKSIILGNVRKARRLAAASVLVDEFALTEREKELEKQYGSMASDLFVAMHEVLGHGSGKKADSLEGDPADYLKEYYSALEEARADLVALQNFFDPKLLEMGVTPSVEVGEAAFRRFIRAGLTQLRTVPEGDQFEEDHARDHHLIVEYIMRNTGAVNVTKVEGKTYYELVSIEEMKRGVAELLTTIMEIKANGDYAGAKELMEGYGVKFDTELRDEVLARAREVGLTDYTAIVFPDLTPILDETGKIIDIEISYPMDLEKQMLYYKHYFDEAEVELKAAA